MRAWDQFRMGVGFTPEAYLPTAQIVRLIISDSTFSVHPFPWIRSPILTHRKVEEPPHFSEVVGAVRSPGRFL